MIKTKYGNFEVSKFGSKVRDNDRVKILITETDKDFEDDISNFIKDLGKFETYMNGIFYLLNPVLKSSKPPYDLTRSDIDNIGDIMESRNNRLVIYVVAKTDKITKTGKDLKPQIVEKMIDNIEKYHSLKNTLKLFKDEILKGGK